MSLRQTLLAQPVSPLVYLLEEEGGERREADLRAGARALCAGAGARCSSRSYRFPFAVVALSDTPVGVDIERVTAWNPAQLRSILTPTEGQRRPPPDNRWATALWSSKEALAKGLGQPLGYDPRRLESPVTWQQGQAGRWSARSLEAPPGHVVWLCWQRVTDGEDSTAPGEVGYVR